MKNLVNITNKSAILVIDGVEEGAYCDFCGENKRLARVSNSRRQQEKGEMPPDICYECSTQVTHLLAASAEPGEDGQIDP